MPPPSPKSYLTLEPRTPVLDRFGIVIGPVERVLIGGGAHFEGIIVCTTAGRRFVDAPEVRRIDDRGVRLSIAAADVEHPGQPRVLGAHSARWDRTQATESDRQDVVDALKYAYVHDELTTDELAAGVEGAYTAVTLVQLEAVMAATERSP